MTPPSRTAHGDLGAAPVWVLAAAALFLALIGYLLAASLTRRSLPTFAPNPAGPRAPHGDTVVTDTVTVDARDTRRWQFFDFERGTIMAPYDTAGWDLAFRRFHIIAADGIADMGPVPLAALTRAPATGYVGNVFASDTTNPAIRDWYRYGFLSHLLEPNEHVYVVRTRDGHYAKLEILSYYCPGLAAGCLTFRYVYQPRRDHRRFSAPDSDRSTVPTDRSEER